MEKGPRFLRKILASPHERSRINERQRIIQEAFETIIAHTPTERERSVRYTLDEPDRFVARRGTTVGWVLIAALEKGALRSKDSTNLAYASLNPGNAMSRPEEDDSEIRQTMQREIRRIVRTEGIHLRPADRTTLVDRFSQRMVAGFENPEQTPGDPRTRRYGTNTYYHLFTHLRLAEMTPMSVQVAENLSGVNPVTLFNNLNRSQTLSVLVR